MTREEAFVSLGLSSDATPEEIVDRFRRLAKLAHPDAGGDAEAMQKLVQARDAALKGQYLVPVDALSQILLANSEATRNRDEGRLAAQHLVRSITQARVRPYKSQKQQVATLGVLAAGLAALSDRLPLLGPLFGSDTAAGTTVVAALALLALLSGFFYSLLSRRVEAIEEEIAELSDLLDDRGACMRLVQEVFGDLPAPWTRHTLQTHLLSWIESGRASFVAKVLGAADFFKLLMAKAKQHGIIEEKEIEKDGLLSLALYSRFIPASKQKAEKPVGQNYTVTAD